MKRAWLGLLFGALLVTGCKTVGVVLQAQALPVSVHAAWSPNAATDGVISYGVSLDGGSPATVLPASCSATECDSLSIVINDTNTHTVAITATNSFGTSAPATVSFSVKVSTPANVSIKKG